MAQKYKFYRAVILILLFGSIISEAYSIRRGAIKPIYLENPTDLIESFNEAIIESKNDTFSFHELKVHKALMLNDWSFHLADRDEFPWPYFANKRPSFVLDWSKTYDRTIKIKLINIGQLQTKEFFDFKCNGNLLLSLPVRDGYYQYEFLVPTSFQKQGKNLFEFVLHPDFKLNPEGASEIGLHSIEVASGTAIKTPFGLSSLIRPCLLLSPGVSIKYLIASDTEFNVEFEYGFGFSHPDRETQNEYVLEVSAMTANGKTTSSHSIHLNHSPETPLEWKKAKIQIDKIEKAKIYLQFEFKRVEQNTTTEYLAISEFHINAVKKQLLARKDSSIPDLLFITVSELNASSLAMNGNSLAKTPFLDSLSQKSIFYSDVTNPSNSDTISALSILSGLLPSSHRSLPSNHLTPLSLPTLNSHLQSNGYRSIALLAGMDDTRAKLMMSAPGIKEFYLSPYDKNEILKNYKGSLIAKKSAFKPLLSWIHLKPNIDASMSNLLLYDNSDYAHTPIVLNELNLPITEANRLKVKLPDNHSDLRFLQNAYDSEIHKLDTLISKLAQTHRTLRSSADLILCITSTNGIIRASDRNPFSTDSLSQEILSAPLLICKFSSKTPMFHPTINTTPISNCSLKNLLIDFCLKTNKGKEERGAEDQYSTEEKESNIIFSEHDQRRIVSARSDNWKMIYCFSDPYYRISFSNLYNLQNDPAERCNLFGKYPKLSDIIQKRILKRFGNASMYPEPNRGLIDEANELLRSLSYTQ